MTNILFVNYSRSDACAFYRSSGIATNLSKLTGYTIDPVQWNEVILDWSVLIRYDAIMVQRPFDKKALELCQYVKDMHLPLWLDYDDNLFCVPPENDASNTYDNPEVQKNLKDIMALGDVISVTTEELKQAILPYNRNVVVIPNAFNTDLFKKDPWSKRSEVVLWRGTKTHIFDLMHLGGPLNELKKTFESAQWMYLGFKPWFLKGAGSMKALDIVIYHKTIQRMLPRLMHVPLHDNEFNRCKSNIAFIEGSFAGAACVIPSWWDVPGIKYTDDQSFYWAIHSVLSGEVNVQTENMKAWDYILSELSITGANLKRMNLINSLL